VSDSGTPILSSTTNISIEVFAPVEPDPGDDDDDNDDDDVTGGDGKTSGKGSEGMAAWLWVLIGIVTLIIVLGVIFLFVIISRKNPEKTGESVNRKEVPALPGQTSISSPIRTENLIPEGSVGSRPAPVSGPSLSGDPPGASHTDIAQAPLCPKCGGVSQYYSEYECYWCGPCQDYVYRNS